MQDDERTRAPYQAPRARGRSHGRALRGVVDRLLSVAVAMLRSGAPYNPALRSSSDGRRARRGEPAAAGAGR